MNELKTTNQAKFTALGTNTTVTMSSVEMVEYINTTRDDIDKLRHDNFMAKVPSVFWIHAPKFLGTQKYGNGNTRNIYNFPKREACLMAMSYSYELQAKVFDKMTALEAALVPKLPQDYPSALRELAVSYETNQEQQLQLQIQQQQLTLAAPAIAFVDKYVEAKTAKNISEVGKILGISQAKFFALLEEKKVIFKRGGTWLPYQIHQTKYRFVIKTTEKYGQVFDTTKFTPTGIAWIARMLEDWDLSS